MVFLYTPLLRFTLDIEGGEGNELTVEMYLVSCPPQSLCVDFLMCLSGTRDVLLITALKTVFQKTFYHLTNSKLELIIEFQEKLHCVIEKHGYQKMCKSLATTDK